MLSISNPNNRTLLSELIFPRQYLFLYDYCFAHFYQLWLLEIFQGLQSHCSSQTCCLICLISCNNVPDKLLMVLLSGKLCNSKFQVVISRSFVKILNRMGHSIDPWGTPDKRIWKILHILSWHFAYDSQDMNKRMLVKMKTISMHFCYQ